MILKINYKYINYNNTFIMLKVNQNLKMNLIFKKELYQEMLNNVYVKLIINIMQLNILNNNNVNFNEL